MKMGQRQQQQRTALLLLLVLWGWMIFGSGAACAVSILRQKGTLSNSEREDALQAGVRADDLLDFGRKSVRGDSEKEESPDWSKIRKVMEEKRARKRVGVLNSGGNSQKFIPLRKCSETGCRTSDGTLTLAGVMGTLSEVGLEYVKEVIVGQILDEITPLSISDISSRVNSPIGRLDTVADDVVLAGVEVNYSDIDLGPAGITIYAAGIRARMTMHWEYHYTASYVPFPVWDEGRAEVMVKGMQAGVTFTLVERNGTLGVVLEQAGTYIQSLDIIIHGGAAWIYQWLVYAFDYDIRVAVEEALTHQMATGVEQLDNWLLSLPRAVPIDDTSAIDVTVINDPLLSPTFLSVGAKGEFISLDSPKEYPEPDTLLPTGLFCNQSVKMLTLALSDYVLNSAAFVYYESGELSWDVDNSDGKKYLNTASWRYIIPKLYKQYPNDDMILNFAVSSAPTVDITSTGIKAQAGADMTIEVQNGQEVVPVACIGLVLSISAKATLNYANISGEATLDQLSLTLKWSDIGSFPVILVQATVKAIVQDFVIPLLNLNLKRGFPIPMIDGVAIENADLKYEDGYLLICTDIRYTGGFFRELKQYGSVLGYRDQ